MGNERQPSQTWLGSNWFEICGEGKDDAASPKAKTKSKHLIKYKTIESDEQEYKPDWSHSPHINISRAKPSRRQLQLSCWEKDTAQRKWQRHVCSMSLYHLKAGPPPPPPAHNNYGFIIQKYNPKTCLAWFPFQTPVSEFRVRGSPMPHPSLQPAHPPMSGLAANFWRGSPVLGVFRKTHSCISLSTQKHQRARLKADLNRRWYMEAAK